MDLETERLEQALVNAEEEARLAYEFSAGAYTMAAYSAICKARIRYFRPKVPPELAMG